MEKEELLKKIFKLKADASNMEVEANKLGQQYTEKYSPYKKGDKLIIKYNSPSLNVIIERILFNEHSDIEGFSSFELIPYSKDWSKKMKRNKIFLSHKGLIIKQVFFK